MARIQASLADVSTEFVPSAPGVYIFEINDVVEQTKDGKITYQIKSKIIEPFGDAGDADSVGKVVTDFISIHSKDGSINQYGLITLKRYFEAVLGKDNVAERGDDLDTDELKGQRFKGQIEIDSYYPKGVEETEENKRYKNVFKAILPLD
jgi:hypothetical protein